MQDYDELLKVLDFNGDHLREIDRIAAIYMRQSASAIRHLRSDRDYFFLRMAEETARNDRLVRQARNLERELAEAIEARRAATTGAVEDESAVGETDAPDTPIHPERETDR